MPVVVVAWSRY